VNSAFSADDVGSILIEENVVRRRRTQPHERGELRRIIEDAGYVPHQRDTLYRSYVLKNSVPVTAQVSA
jgi:cyclic dehypoxanthinyl futalosine synthase